MDRLSLGERLRQERLAKGIDLALIAEETKISRRYLEAIEQEQWDILPSRIFARSFTSQYAAYIGLPIASIEKDFDEAFPREELPLPVVAPSGEGMKIEVSPLPEVVGARVRRNSRMPVAVLSLIAVIALCSAVYVGWEKAYTGGMPLATDRSDKAVESAKSEETAAPPAPSEAQQQEGLASVSHSEQEPGTAIAKTIPVPAGENPSNSMTIEVVASQKTWLSISANGKPVFRGILEPNEARNLAGVERAKIIVGNAGGVDVKTNGKTIGPIGPPWQVRVVVLTPEGPQVFRNPKKDGESSSQSNGLSSRS